MSFNYRWLAVLSVVSAPGVARAQVTPVEPGRVDERLRPAPVAPNARTLEVPELPRQQNAPEGNIPVTLTAVRFEGATAVPVEVLDAIAAPYIGREMPLSEVFVLAEKISSEYRRRGFVLSRAIVGAQRIDNGVLTLQIIEGHIGKTAIDGEAGGYARFLESYLADAAEARPTTGDALNRALLLARDLGGIDVRAVLTPSVSAPAAADLTLSVERKPIEGFIAVDNRGSRWLGPLQVYGGLIFNDLIGAGERISLTGVSAPIHSDLGYLSVTYDQPVGASGLRLSVFGSYVATRPGDELRRFDLRGRSLTFGGAASYPFVRSRETNLFGRVTFTGRDSQSANIVINPLFRDKTRTVQAELFGNYAASWGSLINARVSVTQGLDIFGGTVRGDADKSRATGSGTFTRLNFELSIAQKIAGAFYVQASTAGQISNDSLLASEEFGLGGEQYARAYDPSEITGDEGVGGRFEAFYAAREAFGSVQPYAYYEIGRVRQNRVLPGEAPHASLESAGAGVRLGLSDKISGSVEYAAPLGRRVASRGNKDGRVFFTLSAAF
ncbi:ShlB/FhaC/HecB family hemolysin secretion/activation protein [Sphingomonas sp. CJ20]